MPVGRDGPTEPERCRRIPAVAGEQDELRRLAALEVGELDPVAGRQLDAEQAAAAHDVALDTGVERPACPAVRTRGRHGATIGDGFGHAPPCGWTDLQTKADQFARGSSHQGWQDQR